jgi:hypothetical protein
MAAGNIGPCSERQKPNAEKISKNFLNPKSASHIPNARRRNPDPPASSGKVAKTCQNQIDHSAFFDILPVVFQIRFNPFRKA